MSFFNSLKTKLAAATSPSSRPELHDVDLPTTPAYCTPNAYEVSLNKGWLLIHTGLNRRQRRELESLLSHFVPNATLRNFHPAVKFPTLASVKRVLRSTPTNFPIRKVANKYLFEPEFWQLVETVKLRQKEQALANKTAAEIEVPSQAPPTLLSPIIFGSEVSA